ncbi:tripartite motif-containing protein 35-like isoform X2 [Archocentrus centrarchus]|nr:tripartite motif-containing protein 35-like isoform X2 [Archocentrus centrarchus]
MSQPPRNLVLKNLSDNLRQERSQAASESKERCSLHSEKLRLFCENDQKLICVVCRDAKQHKKHNCVPINEAAEEHRTKVKIELMHLKRKLGSFKREKLKCDEMANHIKLQAQNTEKAIRSEFQKLYQFLRAEEAGRIDAVRKEATLKSETMNLRIVNLTAEISSLRDKIKTIEGEVKAGDMPFMMNIRSTIQRSQCKLSEPVTPSGALIDEAKHLGNLLFSVWKKMMAIIHYTPVVLDPNTCCRNFTVSEHLTSLTPSSKPQSFPYNPERDYDSVFGHEGFTSGKHSWDVELSGYWSVGVRAKITKNHMTVKKWGIYVCVCTGVLREIIPGSDSKQASDNCPPQKVRVQLDYDQGILSFFDLGRKMPVYTIRYRFTEKLFPYFHEKAKILPAELSVTIKQLK